MLTRLSKLVKGRKSSSSPSIGRSQDESEATNSASAVTVSPVRNTSTLSVPFPVAYNPTPLSIQSLVSQASTNEPQQLESRLRPTATPCLPSPPVDRLPTPQSFIDPTPTGSAGEVTGSNDLRDRSTLLRPPQPPCLPVSQEVSFFERARDVKTGDLNLNAKNINIFNEGLAQQQALELRK